MTVNKDSYTEVTIEEIVDLIREGSFAEILYEDAPYPIPNVITIVCEDKYSNDIREIKPVITTHSPTQILIRSHDKNNIITSWKEFFVHSANLYCRFKIDYSLGKLDVETKVDESLNYSKVN